MTHTSRATESAALLVVSRFRVAESDRTRFLDDAARALDALAVRPGCRAASLGQSTDEADLLVIRTEWEGVGAYRRALSDFDVKVHAIPLLSSAIDEPSAYELIRHHGTDAVTTAPSGLAADAGSVRLGEASSAIVPAVES